MEVQCCYTIAVSAWCSTYQLPGCECTVKLLCTPLGCIHALYIHLPPSVQLHNKFFFRFRFSSCFILLISEVKFHWTNIKKISMVSLYSLRPVYTVLHAIINSNVIASFVEKKKFWDFVVQKKFFCVHTQPWNLTLPLLCNYTHLA